ncbi:hypothetical protein PFBG_06247 [Plasmodium falciparum 7G8]|uniref:Zinc finger Ran-binding domain-containing protein 2 n=1 Tax=Plasmodium falciparum (isolate 7G8) TaxID=57266 RepID=W7ESA3_PLAF8|nr:hypothetical protein PFBG_06247 [Plasmodium falciparum 7G8]
MDNHKYIDKSKSGDWICTDENCRNVNFSKRTHCNRCNRVRPKSIGKNTKNIFFKSNDWKCDDCGNINWAKREKCNICSKSRYTKILNEHKNNKEIRTGKGGGHYDIQHNNEKRVHDSEDEEYDEFGRKKKKKIKTEDYEKKEKRYSEDSRINNHKDISYKHNNNYKNKNSDRSRSRSVSSDIKRKEHIPDRNKYDDKYDNSNKYYDKPNKHGKD